MVYSYTKRSISAVLIPSRIFSSTQSNTAVFNSPLFLIPSICSGNLMSFREGTSLPFFPNTSLFYQLLSKACPEWDAIDTLLSSSYLNFFSLKYGLNSTQLIKPLLHQQKQLPIMKRIPRPLPTK